jgi:putative flippase GtrA
MSGGAMDFLKPLDALFSRVYRDYVKLVKYLAVGIVGTLADWLVFALIIGYTSLFYVLAMAMSYFVGMIINYVLNRRFTFNNKYKKVHYQFASFAVIALIGLGIQEALMVGLVHYLLADTSADLPLIASRVIATFAGFAWTFVANKKITFKVFQ